MAGDTVLKIALDSDAQLQSQNRYTNLINGQSQIDYEFCRSFEYALIADMSLMSAFEVDQSQLFEQLQQLAQANPHTQWLLKTHCYYDFAYPVIDIVIDPVHMPFVVKAGLYKNSRAKNLLPDYHVLISKITDPKVLYKFDCFNYAQDLVRPRPVSSRQISLQNILGGWQQFKQALAKVDLPCADHCEPYYTSWLDQNTQFMPSSLFADLVQQKDYDHTVQDLSIEEKYSMLALSGHKFKVLQ